MGMAMIRRFWGEVGLRQSTTIGHIPTLNPPPRRSTFFTTPADRTVAPYYYSHYSAIGSSSSTYPRRFNHRTNHNSHLSVCLFLSDFQLGPCARRHSAGVVLHGSIHLHQSVTKTVFTNVLHRTHNNGRHSWAQETVIQIRLALQRKKELKQPTSK